LLRKFEKNTTGRHSWAKSVQAQNSLILCCIAPPCGHSKAT
jgi:hypothetical protein